MDRVDLFEFFVEGHDQESSHVLLHITEPATRAEREKGYFFALVEIKHGTVEQIEYMQHIIDDIESTYYDTNETDTEKDPFEATLEFMNRRSAQVLDDENEVHSLVGVIRDDHISFSYHGETHAMLFYKKNETFNVTNILESYEEDTEDSLFSSLVQGDIQPGDVFLLATPGLQKYFSHDRLRKLLSTRNAKETAQHVQKVLSDLAAPGSFGGIFYHIESIKNLPNLGKRQKESQGSQESLDKLLAHERQTAETLSPPLFGNFGRKKNKKKDMPSDTRQKKQRQSSKPTPETNYRKRQKQEPPREGGALVVLGRGIFHALQWLWMVCKKIGVILGRFFIVLVILVTNKNNSRKSIISSLHERLDRSRTSIKNLSLVSKGLFVGMVVLAIVFIGSISAIKLRENKQAKTQAYTTTIEQITEDIDKAEAAILYDNNEEAITLLESAREELDKLKDEKDGEEERAELAQKIETIYMDLRKVAFVEPTQLATLPTTDATRLAKIDNTLIAYSDNSTSYHVVGIDSGSVEQKEHDTIPVLGPSATPKEQLDIVFMSDADTVGVYNKETKTIAAKTIGYPNEARITGAAIYNLSLYTLDPSNSQIYKHNRTQTGYDRGTPWVRDTLDLSDATSIAIDGDIYVLKKSGGVIKFNRGGSVPFDLDHVDPALQSPSTLWTSANVEYIYILETENKRVLVFDKRGRFVGQHTNDAWTGPTDMIIDDTRGAVYILDANTIHTFDIPKEA